jgi:TetR/AcrR family transcriptional regulator, cholesterol catabolism regulator
VSARSTKGHRVARTTRGTRAPRLKPGVKREQIFEVAIEAFGRDGYEETKWADIAAAVNIGSTALYHYFESKQHCLFEIMAKAVADFRERFDRITAEHDDWTDALIAVLEDQFDLTDQEVLRQRVLVAEIGRLAVKRPLPREEAARASARTHVRDLEFAWGAFLARGMQQGVLPESDPRLLTRALLGFYNSVWHWYHPGGPLGLGEVRRFFISRELALLGCSSELEERLAA